MKKNMARHLRLKHYKVYSQMRQHLETKNTPRIKRSTSWVKGSWAKKYCYNIGGNKFKCNICEAVLRLSPGLYGNMKRHIRSKHPYVYEQEIGLAPTDTEEIEMVETEVLDDVDDNDDDDYLNKFLEDVKNSSKEAKDDETNDDDEIDSESDTEHTGEAFLTETDPEFALKIKYLVTKPVTGKKRARHCIWNFFNVIEENHLYSCLACNKRVAIFRHSIANLKRHVKMRHKKQYEIIMKYIAESDQSGSETPISFDKYYFDTVGDDEYKCKECGNVIVSSDDDQQALFDHIKDNHPDQILAYQEENLENEEESFEVLMVQKND